MKPDDIIPYAKIVAEEGVQLQKGMNYASGSRSSIFLMSIRKGAPYRDEIDTQSGNLIYEGHATLAEALEAEYLRDEGYRVYSN